MTRIMLGRACGGSWCLFGHFVMTIFLDMQFPFCHMETGSNLPQVRLELPKVEETLEVDTRPVCLCHPFCVVLRIEPKAFGT